MVPGSVVLWRRVPGSVVVLEGLALGRGSVVVLEGLVLGSVIVLGGLTLGLGSVIVLEGLTLGLVPLPVQRELSGNSLHKSCVFCGESLICVPVLPD